MMTDHDLKSSEQGPGESGFALMETAVVFMIAAVVTAFALPAVSSSIKAYNLRSAASHLAERISAVRALAMAKNKNVTFSFDRASGQYGFDFTGSTGDGIPDKVDPDNPGTAYYTESLPSGIKAVFPESRLIKVTFNSRGEMPIGGVDQSIVLRGDRGTATVVVNLRGKISVQ
jgi:Tfp pilus assembly protein FimT